MRPWQAACGVWQRAWVAEFGLESGDRVGILSGNCPDYLEVLFAAWHAGLIVVPINARLHRDEVAFIVADSATAVVFADEAHAATATAAGAERVVTLGSDAYRPLTAGPPGAVRLRPQPPRLAVLHERHHRPAPRAPPSATATSRP